MKTKIKVGKIDTAIGRNLRAIRHLKGLNQEELGKLIGVSFQQIQKYEKGKNKISAATLIKLSDELNEPINVFLYGAFSEGPATRANTENVSKDIFEIIALLQKIPDRKIRTQLKVLLKSIVESNPKK
jgi:transcriptional regulator with XRE-family HTH domain